MQLVQWLDIIKLSSYSTLFIKPNLKNIQFYLAARAGGRIINYCEVEKSAGIYMMQELHDLHTYTGGTPRVGTAARVFSKWPST